jgi:hypothetical protein
MLNDMALQDIIASVEFELLGISRPYQDGGRPGPDPDC